MFWEIAVNGREKGAGPFLVRERAFSTCGQNNRKRGLLRKRGLPLFSPKTYSNNGRGNA